MRHENRKTIFKEELEKLHEHQYLDQTDYEKVAGAYDQYFASLVEQEEAEEVRLAELRQKRQEEAKRIEEERREQLRLKKEAKKLSPEQVRERNISLSLIAGVILLLLGGMVLATSSWEKMNHLMKVLSIGGVSLLFFGISYVSNRYLKIEKTSFAFLTLASLLIPVTFVGIGYFQLFGEWLSLYGEGKYILGLLATAVCLPLYTWIANQNKNRLFVWLSFATLTVFTGFFLAAVQVPIDLFYLGIIIYNGLLLVGYHYLKTSRKYDVFVRELPVFSQLNLIISTLLMLAFFQSYLLYSVNILLTAVMYMAIVFVYNKKEFHYVFTLLFVYGMYQLLEHSFLQPLNYLGFALIGIVYLVLEDRVPDGFLKKVFRFTSGIVSGLAFLYISFEGLVLRADEKSIVLLIAYLVISVNYIYLAHITNRRIFQYLAPIFLVATGYQSWNVLSPLLNVDLFETYMFVVAVALFLFLYVKNRFAYLQSIQHSSLYVALATMLVTLLLSAGKEDYLQLAVLLVVFGFVLLVVNTTHSNKDFKELAAWGVPISWLFGIHVFYHVFGIGDHFYFYEVGVMGHLALASLLLLGIGFIMKKILFMPTFTIAVIGYTLALLGSIAADMMPLLRSAFYLIGIALYVVVVTQSKNKQFWTFVAIGIAAFLLTLIEPFKLFQNYTSFVVWLLFIPVVLLVIYEFVGRKIADLKPYFFWTAHGLLVVFGVLSLGLVLLTDFHPVGMLLPILAYGYSIFQHQSKREWMSNAFLYAALSSLSLNVLIWISYYQLNIGIEQSLTISLVLVAVIWAMCRNDWKERVDIFLFALGFITLLSLVAVDRYDLVNLTATVLTSAFMIYLLFKRKWDIGSIVPLLLTSVYVIEYFWLLEKPMRMMAVVVSILLLHGLGTVLYKSLFKKVAENKYQIDWFTFMTPLFLFQLTLDIFYNDPLWLKLIAPVILVYLLFMQIRRVPGSVGRNVVITITAFSGLIPYYLIVDHFDVPSIIEAELIALPFIALTIFLSKKAWAGHGKTMNTIQAVVLVLVTLFILGDALESNTIYDAIIVGGLALVSIIAGMHYRIKSYFFVGIAVLLINVFLQTKPFWGNLPWWMYLIIGGATLIGFASFYEWQKQRPKKEGKTLLQEKKEKFLQSFKDWK
ncbi:hypothetical protein DS745_02315 [Anaerobacillus alkaliphilus]|uniref:DUF2157 domain-containing protein n=1 Tax=Anaerobacillus alkaliphilus TaxID=1548597 RepID=A0A4Q0W0F2_9BACI|nr:MAP7 domain-containing protein [Anaerobacillus alkaliphilus]RXJ04241.1 hypothetical protein DS745_02315 [Anaerobacillus alkaliphilus]